MDSIANTTWLRPDTLEKLYSIICIDGYRVETARICLLTPADAQKYLTDQMTNRVLSSNILLETLSCYIANKIFCFDNTI